MKTIRALICLSLLPVYSFAQGTYIDKDIFNVCAAIVFTALLLGFILALSRQFLEYRVKTKIADSGLPENVISSIMQQEPPANKLQAAKWAIILAGICLACTIIYFTLPLGIHSLAILAACLSVSFGVYYLFLQKNKR